MKFIYTKNHKMISQGLQVAFASSLDVAAVAVAKPPSMPAMLQCTSDLITTKSYTPPYSIKFTDLR